MHTENPEQANAAADARLTGHAFDGIQEYDNPTPGWWWAIFLLTIIFSFVYIAFSTGEFGSSPYMEHHRARRVYFDRLFGQMGTLEPTEETLLSLMADPKWMVVGGGIFAQNCGQCHATDGTGINCPNLTDNHYINIKKITDIYTTISDGVVAKGMPAWGTRLNQNQRVIVAAFVASLRTENSRGKAPEPEAKPIPPWPPVPAPTSESGTP